MVKWEKCLTWSISLNLAPITFALLSKKCLGQVLPVRCLRAAKDLGLYGS
ncbi:hypothetical protein EJ02DRAFT_453447 [Clathrospora elynae]|uniref:Uncharacterized protein n=1 Tax=Clathrospora elynae TaxID=706981 RepID=A0A6A5SUJ4_9PLEO|nr:hypothetical protein EJ02DRAFT_453447 [Clathrospora elynae]